MSGKQLYDRIQQAGLAARPGTPEHTYAQTVRFAALSVDSERLYALLKEAEQSGQRLRLTYPIDPALGPSEPSGVELVGE